MKEKRNLRRYFTDQKRSSKERGIEFLLTFDEWLKEWVDSGHLHERGRKKGQYCMARFGDTGPYAVGNVKIILHSDNVVEGQIGKPKPAEMMENLRLCRIATPASEETKLKISIANKGKTLGKPKAEKTRLKMLEANRQRSKFTLSEVQVIRSSYIPRKLSQRRLAEMYGVSELTIWNIINNKVWALD
jgi:hypothetical protein